MKILHSCCSSTQKSHASLSTLQPCDREDWRWIVTPRAVLSRSPNAFSLETRVIQKHISRQALILAKDVTSVYNHPRIHHSEERVWARDAVHLEMNGFGTSQRSSLLPNDHLQWVFMSSFEIKFEFPGNEPRGAASLEDIARLLSTSF